MIRPFVAFNSAREDKMFSVCSYSSSNRVGMHVRMKKRKEEAVSAIAPEWDEGKFVSHPDLFSSIQR